MFFCNGHGKQDRTHISWTRDPFVSSLIDSHTKLCSPWLRQLTVQNPGLDNFIKGFIGLPFGLALIVICGETSCSLACLSNQYQGSSESCNFSPSDIASLPSNSQGHEILPCDWPLRLKVCYFRVWSRASTFSIVSDAVVQGLSYSPATAHSCLLPCTKAGVPFWNSSKSGEICSACSFCMTNDLKLEAVPESDDRPLRNVIKESRLTLQRAGIYLSHLKKNKVAARTDF